MQLIGGPPRYLAAAFEAAWNGPVLSTQGPTPVSFDGGPGYLVPGTPDAWLRGVSKPGAWVENEE